MLTYLKNPNPSYLLGLQAKVRPWQARALAKNKSSSKHNDDVAF